MIIWIELDRRLASVGYDRGDAYEDSWCIGAVFVDIVRGESMPDSLGHRKLLGAPIDMIGKRA